MSALSTEELAGYMYLAAEKLVLVVAIAIPAHLIIGLVDRLLGRVFDMTEFEPTLEKFVHKTVVALLWLTVLGIVLVILGVDVNAVVTSFGVGSFIIGFALKDTLNNFASGIMILLNKPFIVGDEIEVKGIRGSVKSITMSHTKMITQEKVKVTMPNALVWSNPVKNYTAYQQKPAPGG